MSDLLQLDLAVERLLFTSRGSFPSRIAVDEFDRCCRELERLLRQWPESEPSSAKAPDATGGERWRLAS